MLDKLGALLRRVRFRFNFPMIAKYLFRIIIFVCAFIFGFSLYYRTTNLWALKNLGDSLIAKTIGRRPIVLGAFHRQQSEQNVGGSYAVSILASL